VCTGARDLRVPTGVLPAPSPPMGCTAVSLMVEHDNAVPQVAADEWTVGACLCARTAYVPYASSAEWDEVARSSARGQRYVAVWLTKYALSTCINADRERSSQLGAYCLGGHTLYRPFTIFLSFLGFEDPT